MKIKQLLLLLFFAYSTSEKGFAQPDDVPIGMIRQPQMREVTSVKNKDCIIIVFLSDTIVSDTAVVLFNVWIKNRSKTDSIWVLDHDHPVNKVDKIGCYYRWGHDEYKDSTIINFATSISHSWCDWNPLIDTLKLLPPREIYKWRTPIHKIQNYKTRSIGYPTFYDYEMRYIYNSMLKPSDIRLVDSMGLIDSVIFQELSKKHNTYFEFDNFAFWFTLGGQEWGRD